MPIRLNLLAEEQAAEELRRRDPMKRAVLIAVLLVGAVLVWSSLLQYSIMRGNQELGGLQRTINLQTNLYQDVLGEATSLQEMRQKLVALNRLATNRFLWASVLNALQQPAVDDVQLLEFRGQQSYVLTEETKPKTGADKSASVKPATATEKIVLTLRARDTGPGEGANILKYMETLAGCPYFQEALGKTNQVQLASRAPPQENPETGGKSVGFALECRLLERTR